jgi:tetratricopeptide (TPR) repeat protein
MKPITLKPMRVIALVFVAAALLLALPLRAQKDFNQAEKETVEKYKRARAHFLKGGEHLKKGKMDKARKEAETALEIFSDYAEAHLLMAQLEYQDGRYENALKEVTTAKTDFSTFGKLYTFSYQEYLDRLREQRDEKQEIVNTMAAAVSTARNNVEQQRIEAAVSKAKQDIANIDMRLNNPIPATMELPAEYQYIHGNILFKLKRYDEALALYQAAVQADPRHANAYNNLIGIAFARNDVAGALKYLEQAEASGVTVNEKLKKAVLDKKPPQ